MSVELAQSIVLRQGISDTFLEQIKAVADTGRTVSAVGEMAYIYGLFVSATEDLRCSLESIDYMIKESPTLAKKTELLERRSRNAIALAAAARQMFMALKGLSDEEGKARKVKGKVKSFMPEQVIIVPEEKLA